MPAWRSAAGTWADRRATLVVAEVDGARGLGEDAPLPGLSADPTAAPAWARYAARLDATARARGVAMASLLASAPAARVPLCAVVDTADAARAAVAAGFRTLKVKLWGTPPVGCRVPHAGVAEIRAAVGPDVAIRVDANRSATVADVDALAAYGLEYVEEPGCDARGRGVAIALDESLLDDPDLDGIAVVTIKPTILGPERALATIARARRAGVDVVISHALEGPVGFAACAELALAVGGTRAHGLGPHPGLDAWGVAIPTLGRGALVATPRAGTGLDVDAVLARARELT